MVFLYVDDGYPESEEFENNYARVDLPALQGDVRSRTRAVRPDQSPVPIIVTADELPAFDAA